MRILAGLSLLFISISILMLSACKPNLNPKPELSLTEGIYGVVGTDTLHYTFKSDTATAGDSIVVGVTAKKTEDNLERFNISFGKTAYSQTTLYYSKVLDGDEAKIYNKDFFIKVPNLPGKLYWTVMVIDADGNKEEKTFELLVL